MFIQKALGKEQDMYLCAFVCDHECIFLWGNVYTWSYVLESMYAYVYICSGSLAVRLAVRVCSYTKDFPGEVEGILCKPCVQV